MLLDMLFPIGPFPPGSRRSSSSDSLIDFTDLEPQYNIQVYDGRAAPQGRAWTRGELCEGIWVLEIHHCCRRREIESVEKHLLHRVYIHAERQVESLLEFKDFLSG